MTECYLALLVQLEAPEVLMSRLPLTLTEAWEAPLRRTLPSLAWKSGAIRFDAPLPSNLMKSPFPESFMLDYMAIEIAAVDIHVKIGGSAQGSLDAVECSV